MVKKTVLDKIYKELEESSYMIWQSPQSFGQKHVVDWSSVERIFTKFKKEI